jgi:hypothetical protein
MIHTIHPGALSATAATVTCAAKRAYGGADRLRALLEKRKEPKEKTMQIVPLSFLKIIIFNNIKGFSYGNDR